MLEFNRNGLFLVFNVLFLVLALVDEFLFPKNNNESDAPIFQIHKLHQKTIKKLDLEFRLYDCRHTFATRVLDNGIDLLTLASMLGHSNLNNVMRYAHPSETRKNEAIKQMQKKAAKAVCQNNLISSKRL